MQAKAPRGVMALGAYARAVYGEADPAAFFSQAKEHNIEPDPLGFLLRVHVPFAKREELRLEEMDDGIAVHLNGRRCVLLLPDTDYREATAWTYEDGVLAVTLSA